MDKNKKEQPESHAAGKLRRQAEQRLRTQETRPPAAMPEGDLRALVHELQVHQVELEMQNEELRRTEAAAKELRDQYNAAHEQAEKVAREAAELHRTLVERADIGITLIDPALNIVMANTKQAEFVGRNPDELVGKKCYCEYGGLDAICPDCQGLKAMASGIPAVSERTGTQKNGMAFAVRIKASPLFDRDGKPRGFIEVVEDISERKQAEEALAASEARYRKLFDEATEGIAVADAASGEIMDCNEAFSQLSGYQRHELIGKPQTMLHPAEEGNPQFSRSFAQHRKQDGAVLSAELLSKDGRIRQVEIKSNMLEIGGRQIMQGFFRDVTSETRHRRERETTLELMRLLNDDNHTHELVRNITGFLQQWTGCEAVGVRLRDGDDFPYFETRGFPAEFVQLENRLCLRDAEGGVLRDSTGHPVLECMCGNVLCGRFDPALPFFTAKGSFWSNGTSELLAGTSEADRQARTRNRCNGEGYESVALIALRHGGQTIGLLQVNDRAKNCFTPELIGFLENAADQIAAALMQRQSNAAVRESEQRFRSLFENMLNGFAYCRMLFEEGTSARLHLP